MAAAKTDGKEAGREKRREILRKVRKIEIATRKTVNDALAGAYRSVYKGQGIAFDAVRKYDQGDDVRSIDWNVTARAGEPYVKIFHEERELTVMLLIDLSASQGFGSRGETKASLAAQLASLLAFSAIQNNDKVGAILFTDKVEKYILPERGRKHVLRLVSDALSFEPSGRGTNLSAAFEFLLSMKIRRSVVFVISDFQDEGYQHSLSLCAKKHDVVALCADDPFETDVGDAGMIDLYDPETGETFLADLSNPVVRKQLSGFHEAMRERRSETLRRCKVDALVVSTDVENQPYMAPMVAFFRRRAKRK